MRCVAFLLIAIFLCGCATASPPPIPERTHEGWLIIQSGTVAPFGGVLLDDADLAIVRRVVFYYRDQCFEIYH